MDLKLTNQRALVTGSSSGIGAGIAGVLAREGVRVMVHGRDAVRAQQVADSIVGAGGWASIALGDLATDAGADSVAAQVETQLNGIDILVNNAGGKANEACNPSIFQASWSEWLGSYEMNVGAAMRMIQRLVPGMKERRYGRVIQISSASATQVEPNLGDYQAAKAAMSNLSISLARELSRTGVTSNTVSPGAILTPAVERTFRAMAKQMGWSDDWATIEKRFTSELIPIYSDHFGKPEDIGRIVALLASPLSGYMTGANHRVDGGQCRSIN